MMDSQPESAISLNENFLSSISDTQLLYQGNERIDAKFLESVAARLKDLDVEFISTTHSVGTLSLGDTEYLWQIKTNKQTGDGAKKYVEFGPCNE